MLATGSELLDVNDSLQPGKIRNSNTYMILSQIRRAGGRVKYFGKFSDDFNTCFTAVKEALGQVDMLITTGGVSVGDYDYLPAIYEKLGASVLFNKVAMRPRKCYDCSTIKWQVIIWFIRKSISLLRRV